MVQPKKKLSFLNVDEEIIDTLGWERFANVVEGYHKERIFDIILNIYFCIFLYIFI